MRKQMYTVHAYKYGSRNNHSYSVGVYSKKHAALKAAEIEEAYRGGKYDCEVLEWVVDSGFAGRFGDEPKTIKEIVENQS